MTQAPHYNAPPVVEVVIGVRFRAIEGFGFQHYGLYWEQIRQNYPNCESAKPVEMNDSVIDKKAGLVRPRMWFLSEGQDRLLQVENGIFYFNWRKNEKGVYPRFDEVKKSFFMNFDLFKEFLSKERLGDLSFSEFELSYVNHIETDLELEKIFPDLKWRKGGKGGRFVSSASFDVVQFSVGLSGNAGTLTVKILSPEGQNFIRLEIICRGMSESRKPDEWFDIVHNQIIYTFEDITSKDVKKTWGKAK